MSLGQIIDGKYQLLKRISQNEKVHVFSGIEINSEKEVLVKVLKKQWLKDDDLVEQFSNETHALAALDNPHIAQIYDVNYVDDIYYVAMEYIKGDPLFDIIQKKVELPIIVIINIITQLSSVLKDAYQQNIRYRTLKLSNILLQEDGFVKVINFNVPRSILSSNIGEISENVGIGPDIFFLGLLLYELITFRFPLKEKHRIITDLKMLAMFNMQNELLIDNREMDKEAKRELENIIFKATTKEIEFRFNTIEDLQRSLEKWCAAFGKKNVSHTQKKTSASFILNEMDQISDKKQQEKPIIAKSIFDGPEEEESILKRLWVMWFLIGTTVILAVIIYLIW